jgi:hypothetical protein
MHSLWPAAVTGKVELLASGEAAGNPGNLMKDSLQQEQAFATNGNRGSMMKVIGITSTAILSLFLGIAAPAYAQQEQHGEKQDHPQENKNGKDKPEKQRAQEQRQGDHKQQQPVQRQGQPQTAQHQKERNQKNHEQGGAQQQDRNRQQPQRAEQGRQDQNNQTHAQGQRNNQQRQRTPEQQRVQQSAWQQHRSERWESDHRTWQQRGGYAGYRIPEQSFHSYFGPDHGFRIYGRPFLVVGGFPRFRYRGYWVSLVDPWPEYWADNWYDTDDVYISYVDNGYYLFNRRHPSVGIAISISL